MIYIIIAIATILLFAFASKKEQTHTYNASFGNPSDFITRFNHGFAVGTKAFTKKLSVTNFFCAEPTGSGKGTIVTIPCAVSLARGKSSIIFNDVSGELWTHTSLYLAKKGYTILRLDFSDSRYSKSFNPLQECKTIADIQKLCLIIVQNTAGESKGDAFWEHSSVMLLFLFSRYLVFHTAPQYRTLQNLQRLVETFAVNPKKIDVLIVRTKDENLLATYKATLVLGDRTLQSVIASARTSLHLLNDDQICKQQLQTQLILHHFENSRLLFMYVTL